MNERIKELALQAKPSPNLIWEDAELERFAELVRQDYLRELKELKPVAWQNLELPMDFYEYEHLDPMWYSHYRPLYALDLEVTK